MYDDDEDPHSPVLCSAVDRNLHFEPHNITASNPVPPRIRDFTPDPIQTSILNLHEHCNYKPNQKFLAQHAEAINALPSSNFRHYCTLSFHLDIGANVNAIRDASLFYFYIKYETSAQMVNGSYFQAEGWGGVLITIGTSVYLLSPVFHCPKNPRNTIAPLSLLSFTNFFKVIVDTKSKVIFIDPNRIKHTIATRTDNDLDFLDINIVMLNPDAAMHSNITMPNDVSKSTLRPSINAMTQASTKEYQPFLHPKVIEYFVMLEQLH